MKRLFSALVLSACFALTACEAGSSSGSAKSALQANGYTVEVMNETEAKARIQNINWNVSVVDVVYAQKGNNELYLGFYCKNIADADAFTKENIQLLYGYAERFCESPKVGSWNNVAYCASPAAAAIVGIN